jgi:hypothetical protein
MAHPFTTMVVDLVVLEHVWVKTSMPEAVAWVRNEVGDAVFDEMLRANPMRLLRWP